VISAPPLASAPGPSLLHVPTLCCAVLCSRLVPQCQCLCAASLISSLPPVRAARVHNSSLQSLCDALCSLPPLCGETPSVSFPRRSRTGVDVPSAVTIALLTSITTALDNTSPQPFPPPNTNLHHYHVSRRKGPLLGGRCPRHCAASPAHRQPRCTGPQAECACLLSPCRLCCVRGIFSSEPAAPANTAQNMDHTQFQHNCLQQVHSGHCKVPYVTAIVAVSTTRS
jgi:hypothetical protein